MNDFNHGFSKFMSDIIESGVWSRLSPASRTLYPVLLKYSDEYFKEVWPGTEELLRLTGFKTKKSLQEARKELRNMGLIDISYGTGKSSSRYYFRFDYENSKIDISAYRDTIRARRGLPAYPPEVSNSTAQGDTKTSPNQIHIHINQDTQKQEQILSGIQSLLVQYLGTNFQPKSKDFKSQLVEEMLNKYGNLEVGEAIKIAISRGKSGDIKYLEGILRNRHSETSLLIKNKQVSPGEAVFDPFADPELEYWREHLQYRYTVGGTIFFQGGPEIPSEEIERAFAKKGVKIRIFQKRQDSETEMPKVFKFS